MIEENNDFGFSTSSSDEEFVQHRNVVLDNQKDKVDEMYNLIIPLLRNLMKDADKHDTIHWPNRTKSIQEFIIKLDAIRNT